jgi:cytidylate kinase
LERRDRHTSIHQTRYGGAIIDSLTIAIDGPSAAGKSTIGELLAERLGYLYLDTGALYRAVTWVALERGIPIEDERAIVSLSESLQIDIITPEVDDGRQYTVLADGDDVTWEIRRPEVDAAVSPVSAYAGVRETLLEKQRNAARGGGVVAVGRDIGTVVLPDADLKIYLDASPEERARRRHNQLAERGQKRDFEELLEEIQRRDEYDSQRSVAPLRSAPDAVVIDTDNLGVEQVLDEVLRRVKVGTAGEDVSQE